MQVVKSGRHTTPALLLLYSALQSRLGLSYTSALLHVAIDPHHHHDFKTLEFASKELTRLAQCSFTLWFCLQVWQHEVRFDHLAEWVMKRQILQHVCPQGVFFSFHRVSHFEH